MPIPLQLLRRKSKEKDKTLMVPDLSQSNAASVVESTGLDLYNFIELTTVSNGTINPKPVCTEYNKKPVVLIRGKNGSHTVTTITTTSHGGVRFFELTPTVVNFKGAYKVQNGRVLSKEQLDDWIRDHKSRYVRPKNESSKRLLAVRLRSKRIKPSVADPFMCPMSRDVNHYIAKQVMSNPLWNRYNKYDRLIQNALKVCPAHLRPAMCQIDQVKDYLRNCKSMNENVNMSLKSLRVYGKNESLDQIRSKISKLTVIQLKDALKMANKRYDQGSDTVNNELMNELEKRISEKEFVKFLDSLNESLEPPTKVKVQYYLAPKSLQPQIVAIENGVIVSVMNHFDHDRNIVAVEGDDIDVQRYVSGLEPFEGDVQDFVSERKRK